MKDLKDSVYFQTMLELSKDTWETPPERCTSTPSVKKRDKDKVKKRKTAKASRRKNRS